MRPENLHSNTFLTAAAAAAAAAAGLETWRTTAVGIAVFPQGSWPLIKFQTNYSSLSFNLQSSCIPGKLCQNHAKITLLEYIVKL